MTAIFHGFGGRRRDDVAPSRLPPGHYVQSITDVDDKIIRRTRKEHRCDRRFADADRIRDQWAANGVILEDPLTRARWRLSAR